jgi:dolichyldiphosphatase
MSAAAALPPPPVLKPFALTHILYNPSHPPYLSLPLTLLSLSPIFLFVAYFTLIIFTRRFTTLKLALGQVVNEALSLALKRTLKGKRPYADMGMGEVGEGWGMPSSHSQAAGFLVAWGLGYALTMDKRRERAGTAEEKVKKGKRLEVLRKVRVGVYIFGLGLWSVLTAYSRYVGE